MSRENFIEIIRYENRFKNDWDNFIDKAKNSTFLFKRDFMEYHSDRFDDFSLMIFEKDILKAVLPANIKDNVVFSHQGLTYGGLLIKNSCKLDFYEKIFNDLLHFLAKNKITYLEIKILPSIYCKASNDEISYLSSKYNVNLSQVIGSVVYLKKEPIISKSILRNANKAIRKGVFIQETNDFDTFWNQLLVPRLEERYNKKPVHTLDEIKYLKKRFSNEIVLIAAFLENEMIAGTVLFKSDTFVKSQYIGSKAVFNKLGAIDLLHLQIIENLKHEYFDFGVSVNPENSLIHKSLIEWKEQFGARTIVFPTYTFKINQPEI